MAFFCLVAFLPVWGDSVSAAVESGSLLWPMPQAVKTLSERVRALDSEKFNFQTDINSELLNEAFERYMGVIFQAPVAFVPDGASTDVKVVMPMLNVSVTSGDETLGSETDESCKLIKGGATGWEDIICLVVVSTRHTGHTVRNTVSSYRLWRSQR